MSMKKKMALCTPISEELLSPIRELCDITECGELKHGKGNVTEEMVREECLGNELIVLGDEYAGADTIKAWVDGGMKFIGVAKGTPATVDFDSITNAGLTLSYTPGRNRVAVAEYTIGLMIAMARKMTIAAAGLMNGEHTSEACDIYDVPDVKNVTFGPLDEKHPFIDYGIGFELYGKTLGIAGYGAIGREVAVRAKAFGMKVNVYSRDKEAAIKSDIVTLHCPATPENKGFVNKEFFRDMKDGAILINTARGALVNEKDLREALDSGKLAAAAVDVVNGEPQSEDSPLIGAKNLYITPHLAWSDKEARMQIINTAADNLRSFLEGGDLNRIV